MSNRYKGGIISATPPTTSTSAASGTWTLEQQMQAQAASTWPSPPVFIEDLFSTYLYTGNGGTNAINNGIDLAGNGGLVWAKARNLSGGSVPYEAGVHLLYDTNRGVNSAISSNSTSAAYTDSGHMTSFNNNGFTLAGNWEPNEFGYNYASWTFRKQPKFFDIVTYTGTGSNTTIAHSLGSVPGCIMIKRTNTTGAWQVYHRSLANTQYLVLNTTAAAATGATRWNSTTPTSTVFSLGTDATVNASGGTYVAYIFAHDAGGFPVSGGGSTNGISCGSFTTNGSGGATVTLGYEPQFILFKKSSGAGYWYMLDNMRGMPVGDNSVSGDAYLYPNASDAENLSTNAISPNATGFVVNTGAVTDASSTYIYIAIRRGPMKVPTSGTSVFAPTTYTGNGSSPRTITTSNGVTDLLLAAWQYNTGGNRGTWDRLRGNSVSLLTTATDAEVVPPANTPPYDASFDTNSGFIAGPAWNAYLNQSAIPVVAYTFKRAPSFFDVVCYTGTGANPTSFTHNLGVVPEMMIIKCRGASRPWPVYHVALGTGAGSAVYLDSNAAGAGLTFNTAPTSTVFTVTDGGYVNQSGQTYVNYLFSTCAGVSKVGSYTGTGTTLQIDCGFTGGARFVLIKRTDSTGDWYVWDSARGIVAGNDPYLLLNSTAAEVTNTDYVDTYSAGFELSSTAPAGINASGGTYIFLAIA